MIFTLACLIASLPALTVGTTLHEDTRPYPGALQHGPRASHGEITRRLASASLAPFDLWPAAQTPGVPVSVRSIIQDTGQSWQHRFAIAHLVTIANPLEQFHVFEPPLGCANVSWAPPVNESVSAAGANDTLSEGSEEPLQNVTDPRALVASTAQLHHCVAATNGGFFNTQTGACLGNVVSDSRIVQNTGIQNANFGLLQNGSLVVGYLHRDFIATAGFQQLIAGVGWVVRNGETFVRESMSLEEMGTQESGDNFDTLVSARVAVGHDAQGRVMIMQVDGQSYSRGVSLYEFATLLIKYGFFNAINLDGGGSGTFVREFGQLANNPSDKCRDNNNFRCARNVTTIVCATSARCLPDATCGNGRGECVDGTCVCSHGYTGVSCEHTIDLCATSSMECVGHSECVQLSADLAVCACVAGFHVPSLRHSVLQARGNGSECELVDPCTEHNGGCSLAGHEVCVWNNVTRVQSCGCEVGYAHKGRDGVTCEDVDECRSGDPCGPAEGQQCVNTEGAFYCECSVGFHRVLSSTTTSRSSSRSVVCVRSATCAVWQALVAVFATVLGLIALLALCIACIRWKRLQLSRLRGPGGLLSGSSTASSSSYSSKSRKRSRRERDRRLTQFAPRSGFAKVPSMFLEDDDSADERPLTTATTASASGSSAAVIDMSESLAPNGLSISDVLREPATDSETNSDGADSSPLLVN